MEKQEIKLGCAERDELFKKEFTELKIKVALNWFELVALLIISFVVSFKLLSVYVFESLLLIFIVSLFAGLFFSWTFSCFRKYQLTISRFDKEDIYKKISEELIIESKKCD